MAVIASNMKHLQLAVLCLAVLMAAAIPARAQNTARNGIAVSDAWARATVPAAKTGALYLTIRNAGDAPDRLIGIETDRANKGEIHKMSMEGGVMRMRPLSEGLVVPAGATVELKPGLLHGMLIGLKHPLKAGESFAATAVFEIAGRIAITVSVVAMGAPAPGGRTMEMHRGMDMQGGSRP
jgi:copper(I)-binding protein